MRLRSLLESPRSVCVASPVSMSRSRAVLDLCLRYHCSKLSASSGALAPRSFRSSMYRAYISKVCIMFPSSASMRCVYDASDSRTCCAHTRFWVRRLSFWLGRAALSSPRPPKMDSRMLSVTAESSAQSPCESKRSSSALCYDQLRPVSSSHGQGAHVSCIISVPVCAIEFNLIRTTGALARF